MAESVSPNMPIANSESFHLLKISGEKSRKFLHQMAKKLGGFFLAKGRVATRDGVEKLCYQQIPHNEGSLLTRSSYQAGMLWAQLATLRAMGPFGKLASAEN